MNIRVLLSAVLLLVFCAIPAIAGTRMPPRKPAPPPDYFPLKQGYWWNYQSATQEGKTSTFTVKVVSADKQPDGALFYLLETASSGLQPFQDIYSKPPGWVLMHHQKFLTMAAENDYSPVKQFLRNPLNAGDTWTWSGTGTAMGVPISETNQVGGAEDVVVPAGKFRAMKVTSQVTQSGAPVTKMYWYAPFVGLVKSSTDTGSVQSRTELVDYSFKPHRTGTEILTAPAVK